MQGITPNFEAENFSIKVKFSERRGRTCEVPRINTTALASVTSMVEASFPVRGPMLFNSLPINLRNFNGSADAFKRRLDKFLSQVPDQPSLPTYQQPASSNCVISQLASLRAAGIFLN